MSRIKRRRDEQEKILRRSSPDSAPAGRARAGPPAPYTWLHQGGAPVLASDARDARAVATAEDAERVLREVVRQIGLSATLRLLSEIAPGGPAESAKKCEKGKK